MSSDDGCPLLLGGGTEKEVLEEGGGSLEDVVVEGKLEKSKPSKNCPSTRPVWISWIID